MLQTDERPVLHGEAFVLLSGPVPRAKGQGPPLSTKVPCWPQDLGARSCGRQARRRDET